MGGIPRTAARAAEEREVHGRAGGGPGLVIPCRELGKHHTPKEGGVTSIIYCRMAWSTSKLNTRKYNNISLIDSLVFYAFVVRWSL